MIELTAVLVFALNIGLTVLAGKSAFASNSSDRRIDGLR